MYDKTLTTDKRSDQKILIFRNDCIDMWWLPPPGEDGLVQGHDSPSPQGCLRVLKPVHERAHTYMHARTHARTHAGTRTHSRARTHIDTPPHSRARIQICWIIFLFIYQSIDQSIYWSIEPSIYPIFLSDCLSVVILAIFSIYLFIYSPVYKFLMMR